MRREELIEDLVADMQPVKHAGSTLRAVTLWLAIAALYSSIVIMVSGPIREGALHDLIEYPWFALETIVAALSIGALAVMALRLTIPDERRPIVRILPALLLCATWIGFYVAALVLESPHPVSMDGKRDHCVLQTVVFAVPSMVLLLFLARRFMPLWPRTTGALAGAAAAAMPAAWMQFACMYVPEHILTEHIGPVFFMAAVGALIGPLILNRRQTVPRSRSQPMH